MNKLKQKKITFLYQVFAVFSLLFQSFYPALATLAPVYAEEAGIIVADLDKKPASEESAVVYQFESVELKADENEVMGVETGEVTEPEAAETDEALPETAGAVETEEEVREVEESGAIEEVAQSAESDDEGTTNDKSLLVEWVKLGETYVFQDSLGQEVQLTFTRIDGMAGSLSIEEIALTPEQQAELGAVSEIAYDITSSMPNGSFAYDLSVLVAAEDVSELRLVYADSPEELAEARKLDTEVLGKTIQAEGLDHFTVFVVTSFEHEQATVPATGYNNIWFTDNLGVEVSRVSSGTNGITSSEGNYHAEITGYAFTRWNGYKSVFPVGGYDTRVDVYLDMSLADGTETKRFDFSSAINRPDNNHLRDFIFHLGVVSGVPNQWSVAASNNAHASEQRHIMPSLSPITVTETGWYTLEHQFRDVAGVLEVTMNLYRKGSAAPVGTWVRSDSSDIIGDIVGGNRYGWFIGDSFDFDWLAIDNAVIEYEPAPYAFNSTNELNKKSLTPGRIGQEAPYVDLVEATIGMVTLNFINPNNYSACFEYRADGNTSQALGSVNPNPAIPDRYPSVCLTNDTEERTFSANEYLEVRSVFGAERDWDFDWTRFDVLIDVPYPVPAYHSPADGAVKTTADVRLVWYPIPTNIADTFTSRPNRFDVRYSTTIEGLESAPIIDRNQYPYYDLFGLENGTYYWQMRVKNTSGNKFSDWATPRSFVVDVPESDTVPPSIPTNGYPHNVILNSNIFNYTWDPATDNLGGPITYEYQASQNPTQTDGVLTSGLWQSWINGNASQHPLTSPMIPSVGTSDGTWYWQVRAIDEAGNKSDWSEIWSYILDSQALSAPIITKPSPEQYFNTTPILNEWSAVTDADSGIAKYQVAYLYDDLHAFDGSTCPGEKIGDQLLSGCRDENGLSRDHVPGSSEQGGVTIWVRAIDNAGNVGSWSEPVHYYYDATAPNTPSLISPSNNSFVRGELLVNEWTSVSDAHHYIYESYHDAGATNLRWHETFNTNSKSATNVTDTTFWWRVKAVDAAGNESDWSDLWKVTVDNTFPVVNIIQPGDEAFLRGTVEVLGEITEINLNNYNIALYPGTDHASTWNFSNRVWQKDGSSNTLAYNLDTTEFADGQYMIRLAARDKAGNRDPMGNSGTGVSVQIIDIVIDNTAPTSTITPPEGATVENDTVIVNNWDGTIAGTASDNLSGVDKVLISIQKDDDTYWDGTTWVDSGTELIFNTNSADPTNWQYALTPAPTEGTYTIQSHAVDKAGNQENTAKLIIVLDKTIPEVSLSINPANPDGKRSWYQTQPTVTLTSASSDTVGIEYQWNGNSGVWQSYAGPLTPAQGKQVLYYRALDAANNYSAVGVKNIAFDQEVPLAVPSFTIDRNGNEATIEWEKASDNTGIHGYEIIWELEDQNIRRSHKVGASTREYTITDLEDGHWRVRVRAEDLAGWTATAGSKGLTIGEGEVAGVTDEGEIIADGVGGSLLNYFTGLAGEVLGATDENLTDEAVGTGNGLGAAALEGIEGQVAGAETTCEAWRYYLPIIIILLLLAGLIATELYLVVGFGPKLIVELLIAGAAALVIYLLGDSNCYPANSVLAVATDWYWALAFGAAFILRMLGSVFVEKSAN